MFWHVQNFYSDVVMKRSLIKRAIRGLERRRRRTATRFNFASIHFPAYIIILAVQSIPSLDRTMSPNNNHVRAPASDDRRLSRDDIAELARKRFPAEEDPRVSHFAFEPFSKERLGFAGVYDLLTIRVRVRDEVERTLTFFVKARSPQANDFQARLFREEFHFFSEVMPRMSDVYSGEAWAPRCFLAREDLLVLEDLRARGYAITRKLSDDQLTSALRSLARFHASSMLLEDKLQRPLDEVYPGYFTEKMFLKDDGTNWQFMLAGVEVVEAVAKRLNLDARHTLRAYEWLAKEIEPQVGDRKVLCHCDLWCNNVMFDETGANCRLVDFQQAAYTSYAVDLAQFVHLNVNRATKRRLESDLLGVYHRQLRANLEGHSYRGETMGLGELTRDYERKRIVGLVTATQTLPLALLSDEMGRQFSKDDETFKRHMFQSRRDFVMRAMDEDPRYRARIEEVVEDLVGYMDRFISVQR